ncbi:hypothetical protein V6N13_106692 [Hibiscus sabdariffa]|uniref:Uncharacterized protein n=1 Tax=Hibiscus sabdariffa TaxID=183260 RepID=A0ABR2F1I5_9ROSI
MRQGVAEWAQSLSHQLSREDLESNTRSLVTNQDIGQSSHMPHDTNLVQDLTMTDFRPHCETRPNAGQ